MPGPVSPTGGSVVVDVDPLVLPTVVSSDVVDVDGSGVTTVVVRNVLELPSEDPTTGGCAGGSKHAANNAIAKNKGLLMF